MYQCLWIGQFQVEFCLCGKSLWPKLNVCHLFIHSHENQVIFMRNVLHQHLIWKKTNSNWEVEVKSAYEPSGPSGRHLSRFLWHDVTRSIAITPWIGCQSIAGLPPILNSPERIYIPEWREALWESSVTIECSQPGLEPRLLEIEKKYRNRIAGCLHRLLNNFKINN